MQLGPDTENTSAARRIVLKAQPALSPGQVGLIQLPQVAAWGRVENMDVAPMELLEERNEEINRQMYPGELKGCPDGTLTMGEAQA